MIRPLIVRSSVPIFIAFVCLASAGPLRAESVNRIAAVVDDEVITVFDVEINARPQITAYLSQVGQDSSGDRRAQVSLIKKEVLRGLIEQKLLEREVTRLGIPVEDQDIDGQIEKIMAANRMTREDLSAALEREGKSMKEFREQIRKRILTDQYVRFRLKERIEVSDEDARVYYQQHPEEFVTDTKMTLAEIRFNLPAEADAETVRKTFDQSASTYESLVGGADFESTAKAVSQGATAAGGGYLGEFLIERDLKETYRRAAELLDAGQLSTVYRDGAGFFILKCIARSPSGTKPFDDVKDRILMKLRNEATEREMGKLAQELYKKSYVDIKVNEF